jgi:hypothetical protein
MLHVLILTLVLLVAGSGMGAPDPVRNRLDPSPRQIGAHPAYDGREGGEDIATAFVIPGDVNLLPFHDTGATCDNVNDYDEVCPFPGSTSPDVVYSFAPSQNVLVDVDLCASAYDTKVYVYDASQGLIVCNDDACGWQSAIYGVPLIGGETYYIVIDGYGGDCGAYDFTLQRREDCTLECPAGALVESEPPCEEGYVDVFNGGCYSPNLSWSQIEGGPDGCATVCGRGCTWSGQNGGIYRDTDWYEATAAGGIVTVICEAEFHLFVALDPYLSCGMAPEGAYGEALPCTPVEVSCNVSPGARVWLVVSPTYDYVVPESDYVFTICGLAAGATPVEETSWGRIKNRYR